MNNLIVCPACGSEHVTEALYSDYRQLTLGPQFEVSLSNYKCDTCGEEGDFAGKNDSVIAYVTKDAQKEFVKIVLDELDSRFSLIGIERSLELPFRTLNRWKSGDFSATSVVLLRILKVYPWIIDVAEEKFRQKPATFHLIQAAASSLNNKIINSDREMTISIQNEPGVVTAKVSIFQDRPMKPSVYFGIPKIAVGG